MKRITFCVIFLGTILCGCNVRRFNTAPSSAKAKTAHKSNADSVLESPASPVPFFSWFDCASGGQLLTKESRASTLAQSLKSARAQNAASKYPIDGSSIRVGFGKYFSDDPLSTRGYGDCLLVVTVKPGTILPYFKSFDPELDSRSDPEEHPEPRLLALIKSAAPAILYKYPTNLAGTAMVLRDESIIESIFTVDSLAIPQDESQVFAKADSLDPSIYTSLEKRLELLAPFITPINDRIFDVLNDKHQWLSEPWPFAQRGFTFPGSYESGEIQGDLAIRLFPSTCKVVQQSKDAIEIEKTFAAKNSNLACAAPTAIRTCFESLRRELNGDKVTNEFPLPLAIALLRQLGCTEIPDASVASYEDFRVQLQKEFNSSLAAKRWSSAISFAFDTLKRLSANATPNWKAVAKEL